MARLLLKRVADFPGAGTKAISDGADFVRDDRSRTAFVPEYSLIVAPYHMPHCGQCPMHDYYHIPIENNAGDLSRIMKPFLPLAGERGGGARKRLSGYRPTRASRIGRLRTLAKGGHHVRNIQVVGEG